MARTRLALLAFLIIGLVALSFAIGAIQFSGYLRLEPELLHAPRGVVFAQYLIALASGIIAVVLVWSSQSVSGVPALMIHLAMLSLNHAMMIDAAGSRDLLYLGVFAASAALAVVAFVRFTALFPRPLSRADLASARDQLPLAVFRWSRRLHERGRKRPVMVAWRSVQEWVDLNPAVLWLLSPIYALFLFELVRRFATDHNLMLYDLSTPLAKAFWVLHILIYMTAITLGISNFRINYAFSTPEGRRRILWLMQGYVVAFSVLFVVSAMLIASTLLGSRTLSVVAVWAAWIGWPLAVLLVLSCYLVAILFFGLFDPRLVIAKTTVYGALLVALTFIFSGIESLVSTQLVERFGLPDSLDTWVGGGAVALAFGPIRSWLESHVADATELKEKPPIAC